MLKLVKKIVGSANERRLRRLWPTVQRINELEPDFKALSNEALRAKTGEFRARLGDGESLEDILPEAFAAVREASRRTIGLRHFDVQLLGGIVLHQGKIAEMKTGEGKTLVATLALYLNALEGKGAHLVTVNDYLARRDVQWMAPIYHALGLSVASIVHEASFQYDPTYVVKDYRYLGLRPVSRREAYYCDITYGTNNEFGFDYLRDNMKYSLDDYVQRELHYAIVDEVDNILIDEARTPLIISGPSDESTDKYVKINRIIPRLRKEEDYTIDEKLRTVMLTDEGVAKVERLLGVTNLYDPSQIDTLHHVTQALKAHVLFKRDVDYVVKDGEVIIVDEFTGRLMPGRRWSDGLHQAVEAKEGVRVEAENQTLATITIQNYFRMYHKLAGMTGTADTEAVEFKNIYNLDVVVVPTNKPMIRVDHPDVVYKTEREKFAAVVEEIKECHRRGQPVLVGTTSVEKSERLSRMLKREGIRHHVLNAINHEAEANIIAQAGRYGAVTIATNMAGRGTDILLGGNPEFLARADMEAEWIGRAAKLPLQGATRYEDLLRQIRERYDEEVRRIEKEHRGAIAELERRRSDALRRLTEVHHRLLELSPYRRLRERYEEVCSAELLGAVRNHEAIPEAYLEARRNLEAALLGGNGGPAAEREALERARERFEKQLRKWEEARQRSSEEPDTEPGADLDGDSRRKERTDPAQELDEKRSEYEKALTAYELALLVDPAAGADGELAELRAAYREAEKAQQQADRLYEEAERPYREALRRAEHKYEQERQAYTRAVEEIREELQKAPQQYEEAFRERLAHYQKLCAEEREKVVGAGGLHILGTERHEARRIDNQLRGRSGRQGDPGSSRFYLSLEDDLLRIFGADRMQGLMERLGMEEGVSIEHRLVTRAIANAQQKVETQNFDIRKHLLEYDDVMNKQREIIYGRRREVLGAESLREDVIEIAEGLAEEICREHVDREKPAEEWDWKKLNAALAGQFGFRLELSDEEKAEMTPERLEELVIEKVHAAYEQRERTFGEPAVREAEKWFFLMSIDRHWKDHLLNMDHLKEGVGLRGYGQRDPLQEYKREGFELFEEMVGAIDSDVVRRLFTFQPVRLQRLGLEEAEEAEQLAALQAGARAAGGDGGALEDEARLDGEQGAAQAALLAEIDQLQRRTQRSQRMVLSRGGARQQPLKTETVRRDRPKVGRNEPCPCGSGKKFKKCCGSS